MEVFLPEIPYNDSFFGRRVCPNDENTNMIERTNKPGLLLSVYPVCWWHSLQALELESAVGLEHI